MSQEANVLLDKIKKRVQNMHKKHKSVEQENLELKQKLVTLKNVEREMKEKVRTLESDMETLKLARAYDEDGKGDKGARTKINDMVKEIDRCIALLND